MEGRKNNVIISGIYGDSDAETNVKKVLSKLDIEEDICKIIVWLPTSNTKNAVISRTSKRRVKKAMCGHCVHQDCVTHAERNNTKYRCPNCEGESSDSSLETIIDQTERDEMSNLIQHERDRLQSENDLLKKLVKEMEEKNALLYYKIDTLERQLAMCGISDDNKGNNNIITGNITNNGTSAAIQRQYHISNSNATATPARDVQITSRQSNSNPVTTTRPAGKSRTLSTVATDGSSNSTSSTSTTERSAGSGTHSDAADDGGEWNDVKRSARYRKNQNRIIGSSKDCVETIYIVPPNPAILTAEDFGDKDEGC
nr:unnamed protein product [Callosobruchus analis]